MVSGISPLHALFLAHIYVLALNVKPLLDSHVFKLQPMLFSLENDGQICPTQ
jgi:hypothetical protein